MPAIEKELGVDLAGYLFASIPKFLAIMVLVVIFLFNAVRQPLIIWLTVPLSVIGAPRGCWLSISRSASWHCWGC